MCNETLGEGRQYIKRVLKIIVFAMWYKAPFADSLLNVLWKDVGYFSVFSFKLDFFKLWHGGEAVNKINFKFYLPVLTAKTSWYPAS